MTVFQGDPATNRNTQSEEDFDGDNEASTTRGNQSQSNTTKADRTMIAELAKLTRDELEAISDELLERLQQETAHLFPRCLPTVLTDGKPSGTLVPLGTQLNDDLLLMPDEATYFVEQPYGPGLVGLEEAMIQTATEQLDLLGLVGQPGGFVPEFLSGRHMLLAIVPVEPEQRAVESTVTYRNSLVTFRRQIDLGVLPTQSAEDRERIPIVKELLVGDGHAPAIYSIGSGGWATVQLNQDSSPISAFIVRNELTQTGDWLDVNSPGAAYIEAIQQLQSVSPIAATAGTLDDQSEPAQQLYTNPFVLDAIEEVYDPKRPYRLDAWRWGYMEYPATMKTPSELVILYEFEFMPKFEGLPVTPMRLTIKGPPATAALGKLIKGYNVCLPRPGRATAEC